MDPEELVEAFVGVYEPYVRRRLLTIGLVERGEPESEPEESPDELPAEAGADGPVFAERVESELVPALAAGSAWLDSTLGELLRQPYRAQRRGPLEVFQEAMRHPTEAIARLGIEPSPRDPVAEAVLPGDLYDLAPPSSRELGEHVWEMHLRWGAAKAAALARPPVQVGYFGANLMDRSKIEAATRAAGLELVVARTADELDAMPNTVFVDLAADGADDALRALGSNRRVVAFGPHVDDMAMVRARTLGASDAVPRSRFFRDIAGYLPTVV